MLTNFVNHMGGFPHKKYHMGVNPTTHIPQGGVFLVNPNNFDLSNEFAFVFGR